MDRKTMCERLFIKCLTNAEVNLAVKSSENFKGLDFMTDEEIKELYEQYG
ncbi:hypothetical protein [Paenibacillus ferrarius]|nr:hypothetical protein [Paenibacillus ferrarius]